MFSHYGKRKPDCFTELYIDPYRKLPFWMKKYNDEGGNFRNTQKPV